MRDQADKTFDSYLQRVRKYGSNMAESALPSESAVAANPASTRMGNQNDTSWAGWAISSFTNKLTTARGEIQPSTNGVKTPSLIDSRPNSTPPTDRRPTPLQANLPIRQPPSASTMDIANTASTFAEQDPEVDDVMDAWGEMDEEDDSFFDAPSTAKKPAISLTQPKPSVPFEDNGEPDFAGWLAAQSQSKAKKPLPKGLAKPSVTTGPSRPTVGGRTTTTGSVGGGGGAKKLASTTTKPTPSAVAKKIDTKPKEQDESNDWDAWD